MTYRADASGSYSQTFDVQNRLVVVTHVLAPSASADTQTLSVTQFRYDGDGNRVLAVYPDDSQTAYPGEHYEEHFSMVDESDTLQPGGSGVDSYVDQENASTNYGSNTKLLVAGHVVEGEKEEEGEPTRLKHFLLQFDLSDIPEEATVDEAVLTLYCAKSESETERTVNFYRVTGSWTESGVTWNNKPSASSTSEGSIALDSTEPGYYTLTLTSLVQGWVDGTWTNRGVMAKMNLSAVGYDEAYCVSSDGETSSQRPKLEVDWRIEDTQSSYYYLGGQRIALRVEEGDEDDVYWLHTDHLGSTSLLSTITGTQVSGSTTRFLPFGDYRTEPDSDLTDVGFTGHRQDAYIKLVDMKARWYSPQIGRFIQPDSIIPDPSNPQSFNRYSYVNNRPIVAVDPSGHDPMFPMIDGVYGSPSSYTRAHLQALTYYRQEFQKPFEGEQWITQEFGPTHNGVDWGGYFTVIAPADGDVTRAGPDQPAGMWRIGRDPYQDENGTTRYREVLEWSLRNGNPLFEWNRGGDGFLEPERLLATGEWVDLEPGWSHTRGTAIIIEHDYNLETFYFHTDPSVTAGMEVDQGDKIGETANTGWSTGTHLHYGVQFCFGGDCEWLDPLQ